jgi:HAD superfamily hydrolase (TIGR01549 family)
LCTSKKYGSPGISFENLKEGATASYREFLLSVGSEDPEKEYVSCYKMVKEIFSLKSKLMPYAIDVLKDLKEKGKKTTIITYHPKELCDSDEKELGIKEHVTTIKPGVVNKVEAIREICKEFGIEPEDMAYVGDTTHDIIAAKMAGVVSIGVPGYHLKEKLESVGPDYIIGDLSGVKGLIV